MPTPGSSKRFRVQSTSHRSPLSASVARFIERRKLLGLASGSALLALSGCGGGGDDSSANATSGGTAPAASNPPAPTFGGLPAGAFSASFSTPAVKALEPFTVRIDPPRSVDVIDTTDYFLVAYEVTPGAEPFIEDYPVTLEATAQSRIVQSVAPLGFLNPNGAPTHRSVRVAVIRVFDQERFYDISQVSTLRIDPPSVAQLPPRILAAAVLGATGRIRGTALDRIYSAGGANPSSNQDYIRLRSTSDALYSTRVAEVLAPIGTSAPEEQALGQYLTALFAALGINPSDYITRPLGANASEGDRSTIASKAVTDVVAGFQMDLAAMARDMADRVRTDGSRLVRAGAILGAAGSLGVLGAAAAPAAIGIGATMAMVGLSTGLVEGFLLDNVNQLGGVTPSARLEIGRTLEFWAGNVSEYLLPELSRSWLPEAGSSAVSPLRERVGAFLWEVGRSEIISAVVDNVLPRISSNVDPLNFPGQLGNDTRGPGLSSNWTTWANSNFAPASFPSASYRAQWASTGRSLFSTAELLQQQSARSAAFTAPINPNPPITNPRPNPGSGSGSPQPRPGRYCEQPGPNCVRNIG